MGLNKPSIGLKIGTRSMYLMRKHRRLCKDFKRLMSLESKLLPLKTKATLQMLHSNSLQPRVPILISLFFRETARKRRGT